MASEPAAVRAREELTVVGAGDGDSFVASDGVEYRIGLVNTPELGECGGREAADRTNALLAGGFSTHPYAVDVHGRRVARVRVDQGDLGVLLADEGLADDRYLEEFRHENPTYAEELDLAFADARDRRAGLWQTCWADAVDPPAVSATSAPDAGVPVGAHGGRTGAWECHPAYVECLPTGPDLDCLDVGHQVVLTGRDDPYRLDGNTTTATDGVGCDTFPPWSPAPAYPYYG